MMGGRAPEWVARLEQSLPDAEAGTLIVTDRAGVRYLQLDKREIRSYFSTLRKRRLRTLQAIGATFALLVVIILFAFQHNATLDRALQSREAQLARLDESIAMLSAAVPQAVEIAVARERHDQAESVIEMVEYLKRKETVFRAYVNATADFMQDEIQNMASTLKEAGFDMNTVFSRLQQPLPTGGLPGDPRLSDVFDDYVDTGIQDLFDQRVRFHDFYARLPATLPMESARITSDFGMRRHPITRRMSEHNGVDFVSHRDPLIRAAGDGVVTYAERNGGYGKMVTIDHGNEVETLYAHLSDIRVEEGDAVRANDVIGVMGSTGFSTGPHLHFEARHEGRQLDPLKLIQASSNVHEKKN